MARLGVRQRETLLAIVDGHAYVEHTPRGAIVVHTYDWWHPGEVIDSLLDRDLVGLADPGVLHHEGTSGIYLTPRGYAAVDEIRGS